MVRAIIIFCFCILVGTALGQNKKNSFTVPDEILWAGVDRPGDLFLVLKSSTVVKYDNQGKLLGKHEFRDLPTLFDPLDGTQSFYFQRKRSQFGNLSPGMDLLSDKSLDPSFAISPWLTCPSLHELWMLDASDLSLKKTKLRATTIAFEFPLKSSRKNIGDFTYLREYQNYLFVLDQTTGIQMYSSLGKYMRTLGEPGLTYFNFLGEELYYKKGDKLIFVDLYSEEKREINLPENCQIALVTDNSLFVIQNKQVVIYDFKP